MNGIGSQGLQAGDITSFEGGGDCSSDWCSEFNNYDTAGMPLELQQVGLSAPVAIAGTDSATGDLRPLLPFAVQSAHDDSGVVLAGCVAGVRSELLRASGGGWALWRGERTDSDCRASSAGSVALFPGCGAARAEWRDREMGRMLGD